MFKIIIKESSVPFNIKSVSGKKCDRLILFKSFGPMVHNVIVSHNALLSTVPLTSPSPQSQPISRLLQGPNLINCLQKDILYLIALLNRPE